VLAGFFPDPSIIRNGDDYYMTVSSFTHTPGLPILHSRDLVNWQLISYALTRPSQMEMA
jgi:xylan 1,4-beta-xylosidase